MWYKYHTESHFPAFKLDKQAQKKTLAVHRGNWPAGHKITHTRAWARAAENTRIVMWKI